MKYLMEITFYKNSQGNLRWLSQFLGIGYLKKRYNIKFILLSWFVIVFVLPFTLFINTYSGVSRFN